MREAIIADGCYFDRCAIEQSIVGIRTHIGRGATIRRSLCGADYFEEAGRGGGARRPHLDRRRRRAGSRHRRQECAHRTGCPAVNEQGLDNADGDGYYIRNGIIVVPKDGTIRPGTIV